MRRKNIGHKSKVRITASDFNELAEVFEANGWDINKNPGYADRFFRFCDRLKKLNLDEQQLIIELTKHYTIIDLEEYVDDILSILDSIFMCNQKEYEDIECFYIMQLLAPEDFKKTKSSAIVWYSFKNDRIKFHDLFRNKKIVYCQANYLPKINQFTEDKQIILVDDYIGSGETSIAAVEYIKAKYHITGDKIMVLAIAAQEIGLQNLRSTTGVSAYVDKVFGRGISDNYPQNQQEIYKKLMHNIEDKLKVKEEFRFGYKQSEALITLNVTPNNTFPFFWLKDKKTGELAPFQR